jgi:hypothetical protein
VEKRRRNVRSEEVEGDEKKTGLRRESIGYMILIWLRLNQVKYCT